MASTLSIKQFNNTVIDDYFRPYLFQVLIAEPEQIAAVTLLNAASAASGLFGTIAKIGASLLTGPLDYFHCEWASQTTTPATVTTVQNIDFMHTQIKQAGRITPEQWSVTVRDDAKGQAFKYFNDWRNLIYPNIGTETTPSRYKRYAIVKLTAPDSASINRIYTLKGVWPIQMGAIQLDYEQEGVATFQVTLSMDYFEVEGKGA
jgi:hypothetical protein